MNNAYSGCGAPHEALHSVVGGIGEEQLVGAEAFGEPDARELPVNLPPAALRLAGVVLRAEEIAEAERPAQRRNQPPQARPDLVVLDVVLPSSSISSSSPSDGGGGAGALLASCALRCCSRGRHHVASKKRSRCW